MRLLSYEEIETGKYKSGYCLKRIDSEDGFAELWDARKYQIIESWLAEEDGFFINVCMHGYVFTEKLDAKTLPEVCKQFNHIVATLKA